MADVYYAYNDTDLYLSNSDLSSDTTYGTSAGYTCGIYSGTTNTTDYNKSTCTTVHILNEIQPINCSYYFYDFTKVTNIENINYLNTDKVTNMSGMFISCSSLTSLDLSNFNTSNVTNMNSMFYNCIKLVSLDLSNFNTSNVTKMNGMFNQCRGLISLNISSFNTSNVTDMKQMFQGCNNLTSLNIINFDTSNVTDMWGMFLNCSSLILLDVSKFNTSNVTDMMSMFHYCSSLTALDLSNFDTSNVTDMRYMFNYCTSLTIIISNDFDISAVTNSEYMFAGCTYLKGAVAHSSSNANDATFANTTTGYFIKELKAYVRTIKDGDENIIYPQTITGAVFNSDGQSLDTILSQSTNQTALYCNLTEKFIASSSSGSSSINTNYTCDKTISEICEAYNNGSTIFAIANNTIYTLTSCQNNNYVYFRIVELGQTQDSGDDYSIIERSFTGEYDADNDTDSWKYTFTVQSPPIYNTEYDSETNKAATMADLENAGIDYSQYKENIAVDIIFGGES